MIDAVLWDVDDTIFDFTNSRRERVREFSEGR
jgi:hypothetical protein